MEKILIIGASGFIGKNLYKTLFKDFDVTGTYNSQKIHKLIKLDLSKIKETFKIIRECSPDIIINTSAISNVDLCEQDKEKANKINIKNLENLIQYNNGAKLIHFSSDYVFGKIAKTYSESDETCPINYYGRTKELGEQLVLKNKDNLVVRVSIVYGEDRGFYKFVRDNLKENKSIKVHVDQTGTPTLVDDVCDAMPKLLNETGIYHVAGSEPISRYHLALKTAEFFNLNKNLIEPSTMDSFKLPAPRPKNTSLSTEKLNKLGIKTHNVENGLEKLAKRLRL